jgi:hypothetical protein
MSPAWSTGAVHVVGRRACAEGGLSQKGNALRGAARRCGAALAPRTVRCAGEGGGQIVPVREGSDQIHQKVDLSGS